MNRSPLGRFALLGISLAACSGPGTPANPDAGTGGFTFQPSNINLSDITAHQAEAAAENVTHDCTIGTDPKTPGTDCFSSQIEAVPQFDGSTVDLVVVQSLIVAAGVTVTATGPVPLVIVSLSDITWGGQLLANSSTALDHVGPGGGYNPNNNATGTGPGGGPGASATAAIGAAGGTYCGHGGPGGGASAIGAPYGGLVIRPLLAGSAGGSGAEGNSGAGGGGVQLVAKGTLTIPAGGVITVGGGGGQYGGVKHDQNANAGGSGGAILLEAPTVSVSGTLAANGGGGGGDYLEASGADATADANPAPGGLGASNEGPGGAGGAGTTLSGGAGSVSGNLNAGGGGGGVGRIEINTQSGSDTLAGTISPAMNTVCAVQLKLRTLAQGP